MLDTQPSTHHLPIRNIDSYDTTTHKNELGNDQVTLELMLQTLQGKQFTLTFSLNPLITTRHTTHPGKLHLFVAVTKPPIQL